MAREGMDVELGRSQSAQLQTQVVDQIQHAISSLNSLIEQIAGNWTGPDSTQFHGDWSGRLMPQLNTVLQAMTAFHTNFNQNIEQQQVASA